MACTKAKDGNRRRLSKARRFAELKRQNPPILLRREAPLLQWRPH
jgi:hypothetical protein